MPYMLTRKNVLRLNAPVLLWVLTLYYGTYIQAPNKPRFSFPVPNKISKQHASELKL